MFNGLSCVSQGFQGVYKIAQKLKLTVLIIRQKHFFNCLNLEIYP